MEQSGYCLYFRLLHTRGPRKRIASGVTELGVTEQSLAAIIKTTGNPTCHLILRGSGSEPNYDRESVNRAADMLNQAGINNGIMIDCSHGNSYKDHLRQPDVVEDICKQVSEGSDKICGVMLESFLKAGKQNLLIVII